jgi:hypothetical protein
MVEVAEAMVSYADGQHRHNNHFARHYHRPAVVVNAGRQTEAP